MQPEEFLWRAKDVRGVFCYRCQIVFETGRPSGGGGGSKVSDVAAYSADGCLIRVILETL